MGTVGLFVFFFTENIFLKFKKVRGWYQLYLYPLFAMEKVGVSAPTENTSTQTRTRAYAQRNSRKAIKHDLQLATNQMKLPCDDQSVQEQKKVVSAKYERRIFNIGRPRSLNGVFLFFKVGPIGLMLNHRMWGPPYCKQGWKMDQVEH